MSGAGGGKRPVAVSLAAALACLLVLTGCLPGPRMLRPEERYPIDRAKVEYPAGFDLERYIVNLTAPTAIAFDADQNTLVAESGIGGHDVRIVAFRPDGSRFDVYPVSKQLPLIPTGGFTLYAPIGGMVVHEGWVYVSHRDENGLGVITALDYKGHHRTIVADLPAQGEYGVTDLAIDPRTGRLFFGVGTATNSGVVGMDDFALGWPQDHPNVHDIPYKKLVLWGRRFDTPNPNASPLFGIGEIAVSAPFQRFGVSNQTVIPGVLDGPRKGPPKFNGGIFSVAVGGGEIKAEAFGIRYPRGLAFSKDEYGAMLFTNDGMEMRGSRPVKDDPDSVLRLSFAPGEQIHWYGWPDYTTDLRPVTDRHFWPPERMLLPHGYPDLSFVINRDDSDLLAPTPGDFLVGAFPSQSGAAGIEFVPSGGPFRQYFGSALVALSGDRAPFSTGGIKVGPVGYKVMLADADRPGRVTDFIRNTQGGPASLHGDDRDQLERPITIRFGPDGSLYILDFGRMRVRDGKEDVDRGSGKLYRLFPSRFPATTPER
jgi:glucose/arabinose dehydrogenase